MVRKIGLLALAWVLIAGCLASTPISMQAPQPGPTDTGLPLSTRSPDSSTIESAIPTVPPSTPPPAGLAVKPVTTHPRLWITAADLPRLRGWAVSSNPLYNSLSDLAASARQDMDAGKIKAGDNGGTTSVDTPTEMYAELFAFLSLIEPDGKAREDDANRARGLLMTVIDQAAKGTQANQPFRDPDFAINDRSRWTGEGFALTVDWIYPALSKDDKAKIRDVFLRWAGENMQAEITSFNHPEPAGLTNDPRLLADRSAVRYSLNNYYAAHMRNLGLMAMAIDPADDPDGKLGGFLKPATSAWLYVVDDALRTDTRGGMAPEGFEYGYQTLAYILQFQLALQTAGQNDTARWGPQVWLDSSPFWNDMLEAYDHSISPAPVNLPDLGLSYQPAWYGDGQEYRLPDLIAALGTLGVYDQHAGNAARLNAVRWWELNIPAGGKAGLADRLQGTPFFTQAILYFLLFDPSAPSPTDPRQGTPLFYLAPGIGHLFARTSWGPEAAWFQFTLGWNRVDHQDANGNDFGFYRKGEWLTKNRTGYANIAEGIASSEFYNTLALQNDKPPERDPTDWRYDLWTRGSQWNIVASGDPAILADSDSPFYTYALGDSTNLYNSVSENATDILKASRSIVWLKPDFVVIYDRAKSKTAGRFKRFWLQLPEKAQVTASNARMALPSGQQLFISSLLPQGADMQPVNSVDTVIDQTASPTDPMKYRLKIEAPGGPQDTRFLTVLQGADPNAPQEKAELIRSSDGTPYEGAIFHGAAVLFPVDLPVDFSHLTFQVPAGVRTALVTGLIPGGTYAVSARSTGSLVEISVLPGLGYTADGGGVLAFKTH